MNMKEIEDIKILVVGDIMLDKYIIGTVDKISPEAPVPVVNVREEYSTLGGCGNVVRNIREFGVKVDCLASIGNDVAGKIIVEKLNKIGAGTLICFGSEISTVKERIIAEHRSVQMLRIDREETITIDASLPINKLKNLDNKYDMIVISDYAKGMISNKLMKYLKSIKGTNIIVDPKPANAWMYNNVHMITPNEKEWNQIELSSSFKLSNIKYVLKTMGKKGMKLIEGYKEWYIEAEPVDIYNVSGAGDTVVATMAVCLSMGLDAPISARIANKCAGYVVTQPGTSVVPKEKFFKILNELCQNL